MCRRFAGRGSSLQYRTLGLSDSHQFCRNLPAAYTPLHLRQVTLYQISQSSTASSSYCLLPSLGRYSSLINTTVCRPRRLVMIY